MGKGGVKPGNWGNSFIIITPILYKRVSCATCRHFSNEDGGCNKTAIFPPEYKYQYWKKCKEFELSPEYCDYAHREQVRKVKETNCRFMIQDCDRDKKQSVQINHTVCGKESIVQRVHRKLEGLFQVGFKMHDEKENKFLIFSNDENDIAAVLIKKFPSRGVNRFDKWEVECTSVLRSAVQLQKKERRFNQQLVIMPPCKINEDETLAEKYYRKQGDSFKGIHLVEIDKNDNFVIASGPTERYWTAERINNLHIFKEN